MPNERDKEREARELAQAIWNEMSNASLEYLQLVGDEDSSVEAAVVAERSVTKITELITQAGAAHAQEGEQRWLRLYAEARESLCDCNQTGKPELGPEYNYTCEWCAKHPDGNWDEVAKAVAECRDNGTLDEAWCNELLDPIFADGFTDDGMGRKREENVMTLTVDRPSPSTADKSVEYSANQVAERDSTPPQEPVAPEGTAHSGKVTFWVADETTQADRIQKAAEKLTSKMAYPNESQRAAEVARKVSIITHCMEGK